MKIKVVENLALTAPGFSHIEVWPQPNLQKCDIAAKFGLTFLGL